MQNFLPSAKASNQESVALKFADCNPSEDFASSQQNDEDEEDYRLVYYAAKTYEQQFMNEEETLKVTDLPPAKP